MSGKIPPRIDDLFTASAGVDDYGSDQPFEDFCLPRLVCFDLSALQSMHTSDMALGQPIYPNETETPYRVTMPLPNNRSYTTYLIGAAKSQYIDWHCS